MGTTKRKEKRKGKETSFLKKFKERKNKKERLEKKNFKFVLFPCFLLHNVKQNY
jgi:hypothetical protein